MKRSGDSYRLSASDLVGFLNCHYLTQLEMETTSGLRERPFLNDPMLDVLRERGMRHEAAYIDHLTSQGRQIVQIDDGDICPDTLGQTAEAMRGGADIIVQAALASGPWVGKADVLLKVDRSSALGDWSYEVVDTKLSRHTKAGTILQLCLYSDMLAELQELAPEHMSVVFPWSEYVPERWRVDDFAAYYRQIKKALEQTIANGVPKGLYPDPVAHCEVCNWRGLCAERRRKDDHLSLVAGISKLQITELDAHDVHTVEQLASLALPLEWKPDRGSAETYTRIREQARIQVESRDAESIRYELLEIVDGFGLTRLPEPDEGDIFLDFEGDPFVGEYGLEYLTGFVFRGEDGEWAYRGLWATDSKDEKAAFEQFIDFVVERRKQHPGLHVYHYGGYEAGALKRLMGRYAIRQDELDDLLRREVLVDLLAIVRHAVRVGVESYSIKRLEPVYGFERDERLADANIALRRVETSLELGDSKFESRDLDVVQRYNRDDCYSTLALRSWFEALRSELVSKGTDVARPQPPEVAEEEPSERAQQIARLIESLTSDVPVDVAERSVEQQARWILAHLLDWHRREAKAVWWEYFRLSALSAEELLEERAAIGGIEFVDRVGGTDRCPVHRYRFPQQELDVRPGQTLKSAGGGSLGKVVEIDLGERTIEIRKMQVAADVHPGGCFVHDLVGAKPMQESLLKLAAEVVKGGFASVSAGRAGCELLMRTPPKSATGEDLRVAGESTVESAVRLAPVLQYSTLPIQGPPGSGKTFTGARMICELVRQGKKIGVVANSHAVIRNLLDCAVEQAGEVGITLQCLQKGDENSIATPEVHLARDADHVAGWLAGGGQVAGGTAWLWSNEKLANCVDVLFVDEAAQMALANVVAVAQACNSLVLLGDPRQLDQPTQGSHPEGIDCSALQHLLGSEQTISPEQGLFLEQTWRLHPEICRFTSELFYEGNLSARRGLEKQKISDKAELGGFGLHYVPVAHRGNQNSSPEEASVVVELIRQVLESRTTWTDAEGKSRTVALQDILVITPYNAQVQEIQRAYPGARTGTVDKFQGQEAPIAIYSLATSTYADAPRGMEFLYSANRLNVATSRARCLSIVVASPGLFEADCTTPRQMQLANAFCRFLELSRQRGEVTPPVLVG
jgi:predicted RecB family nuclease